MDPTNHEYHISFFKPTTEQARRDRNMVIWLICIWAVAIFGFQILLRIVEEPTPEPVYLSFQKTAPSVFSETSSPEEMREFSQSILTVLSKVSINPEHRKVLDQWLSWSVYTMAPLEAKDRLATSVMLLEQVDAKYNDILNAEYLNAKELVNRSALPYLGISTKDVRSRILPLELRSAFMADKPAIEFTELDAVMAKYLIHNQSFLTDFKFLGFPFHYFYTAVFLLILFVGLCLLYCVRTDRMNKELEIAD